jgi:hypothetical protein
LACRGPARTPTPIRFCELYKLGAKNICPTQKEKRYLSCDESDIRGCSGLIEDRTKQLMKTQKPNILVIFGNGSFAVDRG